MMRFRKFGLAVAVATLALVLNGCGGSSDEVVEPPPPTPVELAQMDLQDKEGALAALGADATNEARLAAEQAVVMAAQGVVTALQAANASVNDVTAAQAMVTKYEAMVAATQMAIADAKLDADLAAAIAAVGDGPATADRLAAEKAVVTAAKAKLTALVAKDASQSEVTAAEAVVAKYEEMVAATQKALDDAGNAASLAAAKETLTDAKTAAAAAKSYADMLAAQKAVVAAANAVAAEAGASADDVAAANEDVTSYTAMIAATEKMKPLDLVGASVKKGLKNRHTTLATALAAATTDADARTAAWAELDPMNAAFDSDGSGTTDGDGAQFSLTVSNQKLSVTTSAARTGHPAITPSDSKARYKASTDRVAPSLGEGWTGSMHERTYKTRDTSTLTAGDDVTVKDILTTYTNQDASEGRRYTEFFPSNTTAVTAITTDGTLTLAAAAQSKAMSAGFPAANQQVYLYDGGTGTTSRPLADASNPLIGTYYGVPGRFTCTGNDCTATRSASGTLSLGTANWRFTPDGDPSAIRIPDTNTDSDYLTFGYWLEEVTDAAGTTAYRAGVYYPAAGSRTGQIAATVTGEATYTGPAAGLFAKREYDPEGGGTVETAGQFTADATLTADFDRAQFAGADGSVSGTITNFMHDGSMIDPMWSVTMKEGTIDADAAGGAIFESNSANQTAGDGSQWRGRFYGHYDATNVTADDPVTPVNEVTFKPTGVAGAFSNTFDNGEVLGAFGATR